MSAPASVALPAPAARLRWTPRSRERTALLGLTLAALALFLAWPGLDVAISHHFYDTAGHFPANEWAGVRWAYEAVPWLGRLLFCASVATLLVRRGLDPQRRQGLRRPLRRRAAVMSLVLALGLGALVHGVFKEHWGRPRPRDTQVFQGTQPFTPLWEPSSRCARNCSFVSGHAATGFALIGVGLFGARATRRRWWLIGTVTGSAIGLLRVAQGGHYASDIVFGLVFMWATCVGVREVWLRARCRQLRQKRR
jgi:lipid A 4'-phosphatase